MPKNCARPFFKKNGPDLPPKRTPAISCWGNNLGLFFIMYVNHPPPPKPFGDSGKAPAIGFWRKKNMFLKSPSRPGLRRTIGNLYRCSFLQNFRVLRSIRLIKCDLYHAPCKLGTRMTIANNAAQNILARKQ